MRDITHRPPYEIIRDGISRSFQVASLFNEMTVLEQRPDPGSRAISESGRDSSRGLTVTSRCGRIGGILENVKLVDIRDHTVNALSHGDRKILDLAMALTTRPKFCSSTSPRAVCREEEDQDGVSRSNSGGSSSSSSSSTIWISFSLCRTISWF